MPSRRTWLKTVAALPAAPAVAVTEPSPWLGRDYWSNPLQDWQLRDGRMECIVPGGDRNVYWLVREVDPARGGFSMSVTLGRLEQDTTPLTAGFAGFRVGIGGYFNDYRDSAVRGTGLECGGAHDGRLFIGRRDPGNAAVANQRSLTLQLNAEPDGRGAFVLTLSAGTARINRTVPAAWLAGGLALVCSSAPVVESPPARHEPTDPVGGAKPGTARGGNGRFWFQNWQASGPGVVERPERAFGPILFAMYTLSRGTVKITAQLAPAGAWERPAELQLKRSDRWRTVARAAIDPDAATARFRLERWTARTDTPYRVVYGTHAYEGVIRHDPVEKTRITAAALTCQNDFGFPHTAVADGVRHSRPDILLFTGDQLYERNGEYGLQRTPEAAARLDYLRKWFLFGWAFGDLTRQIPTVCLPDDHDVFHGNLWGAGGRSAKASAVQQEAQDSGGFTMPAAFVNIVERTQSSHMPDPPDPSPAGQGIAVHYCHLVWGGVSFAVLEDRKWKSAPKDFVPSARILNGWAQNPNHDAARAGDAPEAQLLGPRQEKFLEDWARDWSGGIWMKAAVSATIFSNLATLPKDATTDAPTPKLPVLGEGEWAEGERLTADHDSNGWPQTARNRALRLLRSCCALHIGGDQHLASTIQYGIGHWRDASWAFCTPAISNLWPRRWFPPVDGQNRAPGQPRQFGDFHDGFGNRMTVHAVANPVRSSIAPKVLHMRSPGFGVVEFDKATRRIRLTNWPRSEDLSKPGAKPYAGWPIEIAQTANGMDEAPFVLPEVTAGKGKATVVEVTEEAGGIRVLTIAMAAARFTPRVWREGRYTVRLFDPDGKWQTVNKGVEAKKA